MMVEAPVLDRDEGLADMGAAACETSTGSPMIEPRRAIGSPSAERMVRLGAAIGPSERDNGAVIISQIRISRKISKASLIARLTIRTRDSGGCGG